MYFQHFSTREKYLVGLKPQTSRVLIDAALHFVRLFELCVSFKDNRISVHCTEIETEQTKANSVVKSMDLSHNCLA
jgi:hypothetical protein